MNIKKISLIGLILLLVGAVGSALTFKSAMQRNLISEEIVIEEDFTHIDVTTDNTSVEILPTNDSLARVELEGKIAKSSVYDISDDVDDSTLFINVNYEQRSWINFFPTEVSLTVYVPKKVYESLQIEGNNGRIQIHDLESKEINAKTNNGIIDGRNVNGTSIKATASNGEINLKEIESSTTRVESNNGRIKLDDIEGQLFGKTNNGSISLVTNDLDRAIDFETDNGQIKIKTLEEPKNVMINANVHNGKVTLFESSGNNAIFGLGEHLINLKAHNGSIKVEKK